MNATLSHLINGEAVHFTTAFNTINSATQQMLAQVAAGGDAQVHAAEAAAKATFPAWAGKTAPERAQLIRKLGKLIAQEVPQLPLWKRRTAGRRFRKRASN
jgi:5-carboxymethyl-2-hydroxymuconic-semialdehyde dehydrogenase